MNSPLPDEILAAKAVLLTLCAALGRETVTRFVVGSDERPLDFESAAQYLSALRKAVSCSATDVNANAIKLSCVPGQREHTTLDLTTAAPVLAAKSKTTGGADILLIGAGASIRLTARALERWTNEYAIALPCSIAGDDPTPEQRAGQIHWVLRAGGGVVISTSAEDLQLSPEMTDIIRNEFERARRQDE